MLNMKPRKLLARGISLIEVLVVIVLFSFGLLGLVGLQARALQVSVSAEDTNRAALLANELAATMWNNDTETLDAGIVAAWAARVADSTAGGLPGGVGEVVVNGDVARITVSWTPAGAGGGQESRYITEVLIP
jgi:type IV pilus assembly protein PilV